MTETQADLSEVSDRRITRIKAMEELDFTLREMGKMLGISYERVRQLMEEHGIEHRDHRKDSTGTVSDEVMIEEGKQFVLETHRYPTGEDIDKDYFSFSLGAVRNHFDYITEYHKRIWEERDEVLPLYSTRKQMLHDAALIQDNVPGRLKQKHLTGDEFRCSSIHVYHYWNSLDSFREDMYQHIEQHEEFYREEFDIEV